MVLQLIEMLGVAWVVLFLVGIFLEVRECYLRRQLLQARQQLAEAEARVKQANLNVALASSRLAEFDLTHNPNHSC